MTQLNTDNEFGGIANDILPTRLNVVAANEHVGDVEVSIKTTKECCRCHVHRNPYEWYTKLMVSGCVTKSTLDLNALPDEDGLSKDVSPATLITGRQCADYKEISRLNFGDYVQVKQPNDQTNANEARTM